VHFGHERAFVNYRISNRETDVSDKSEKSEKIQYLEKAWVDALERDQAAQRKLKAAMEHAIETRLTQLQAYLDLNDADPSPKTELSNGLRAEIAFLKEYRPVGFNRVDISSESLSLHRLFGSGPRI
jgi:hypothetical protein